MKKLFGIHDKKASADTHSGLFCQKLYSSVSGNPILNDVSVQFPESGVAALIGANGAGKTALLNVLTGFTRPDSGHCWLEGRDLVGLPPYQITRLGVVRSFQEVRLIRQMSVMENVLLACQKQQSEHFLYALLHFGPDPDETGNQPIAANWLHLVHLRDYGNVLAGELSYGQQKLVSLVCCLASGSRVVLLDEPVAGLDPVMVRVVIDLLQQMRNAGILVVFVEHDMATVREVADEVIVMDSGRIIAQGTPNEVLNHHEILDAFIS